MNEKLTELVMILDRSGSMRGLEPDTIGGYNSMIEKQKAEEGDVIVSTVLFDNFSEVIHDRVPIDRIEPLTEKEYFVRGCTALLDAVGGAIRHIRTVHRYAREEDRPAKTIFVITTDGMENASHHYSFADVKKLVEQQKESAGWEFIFLGADIDAISVAGRFGIGADRAVRYRKDRRGLELNYSVLSDTVAEMRKGRTVTDGWKAEIEEYEKGEGGSQNH